MSMGRISTHVLDTSLGRPGAEVAVRVEFEGPVGWQEIGSGVTDPDGRIMNLSPNGLSSGKYRIEFDPAAWYQQNRTESFFGPVRLCFAVNDPAGHYHVPLLINPFAISSYKGS